MNNHIGIVSGYFNPIHRGHIEYINEAKNRCDFLVVIVNNDKQVELKGSKFFMDEDHRIFIVDNLKSTDLVVRSIDNDLTVSETLRFIRFLFPESYNTFTFFNSGDRNPKKTNKKEDFLCDQLGIRREFINLEKIYSSTDLKNSVY